MRTSHAVAGAILGIALLAVTGCPLLPPPPGPGNGLKTPERDRITQAEIDAGVFSLSSLITFGRALNIVNFNVADGYGNGRNGADPPNFSRLVGPDSTSCNSCHGLGNVIMGWGGNEGNVLVALDNAVRPTVANSNERNTTMVHGAVWVELLSKEISLELRGIRESAVAQAQAAGREITLPLLTSEGVNYGVISALPDGSLDNSGVRGIDPDLRIRPFHAKGHEATVRIFTQGALNRHHGIQSADFLLRKDAARDPATWDEDKDGVFDELNEGELTAMVLYQNALPAPIEAERGGTKVEAGRALMSSFGCTACHVPALHVEDPLWRYTSSGGKTLELDLLDPALGLPRLSAAPGGSVRVELWGDLKRHDLGPESHEPLNQPVDPSLPEWDGGRPGVNVSESLPPIPKELMLTTELWGVGDTGPWWHDGSSPTIEDAILRHGGEALASRNAYAAARASEQDQMLAFLNQLRVGLVGEILVTGKDGVVEVDPREMPLNRATEHWMED